MIIILSGADDPTADRVESELGRRSARYTPVDLSDFPQRITASAYLDNSGYWTGHMRHADGWSVAWEEITAVDWRSDYDSLRYTETPVPDAVRDSISRYLRHFDILYGAFDFSVDRNGCWWFLECNPNGQWGFITEATDLPIASAIADLLIGDTTL